MVCTTTSCHTILFKIWKLVPKPNTNIPTTMATKLSYILFPMSFYLKSKFAFKFVIRPFVVISRSSENYSSKSNITIPAFINSMETSSWVRRTVSQVILTTRWFYKINLLWYVSTPLLVPKAISRGSSFRFLLSFLFSTNSAIRNIKLNWHFIVLHQCLKTFKIKVPPKKISQNWLLGRFCFIMKETHRFFAFFFF